MDLKIGEKFDFKGFEWVVLDEHNYGEEKAVTAIMTKAWATAPFDENNRNDWKSSSIRKRLQEELLPVLGEENLITHVTDMVADNGDRSFGTVEDKVWLLSCDEFRKYREVILNECSFDDWWWTVTPWYIPEDGYGNLVRFVNPSGTIYGDSASYSYGVAPACVVA